MDKIPHKSLQSVSFNVYSSEEIERLSVLEITNVNTFDALDHPAKGGLYDSALGPSDRDEYCDTCGLASLHCPGHLGHITFPLPVFNPVLIQTLYQLLRGSCLNCHSLVAPPIILQLTLHQFEALDYGLIGTVQSLEEVISDLGSKAGGPVDVNAVREKLKTVLETAVQDLNLEDAKSGVNVKNVVECRRQLMKNFIKEHLMGSKIKCPHCGDKRKAFCLRNNSRIVFRGERAESINVKSKSSRSKSSTDEIEIGHRIEKDEETEKNEKTESLYTKNYITPLEAKKHLSLLWKKEEALLQRLFGILSASRKTHKSAIDVFFLDLVVVPPSRFRPVSLLKGRKYQNPQTAALHKVLQDAILLKEILRVMKKEQINTDEAEENLDKIHGKTLAEKLHNQWYQLQVHVNCVADSKLDKLNDDKNTSGVKQILEKKEGLFRKNMMGKRVNYAARSVISPDPYIMVDEIGVPMVFASKLTYPQPVTSYNIEQLRAAVINGPDIYPGAEKVEYEDGSVVKLNARNEISRRAIANLLLTSSHSRKKGMKGCKKVYRHLQNGDVLLLNRQPTLHKPSIMAHRAKVLPGEKTLRLHYANCKSYNADFDGDEMNAHFPQSELARAEAYNIVSVNNQYLVPKDGTPLSGLIQDHVIAGSVLTMRNRFFTREDYQELVYGALTFVQKAIKLLPPSILKPQVLWSGKQVVSTVIINVMPEGKPPPTVEGKAKIASKNWESSPPRDWKAGGSLLIGDDMSEAQVIIRHGELLCGVLDKAHYGPTPYGLIHCCYELYGGKTSTILLTSLARLFTHFLQIHMGFTLGVEDILLTAKANKKRWKVMKAAKKIGDEVAAKALNVTDAKNHLELKEKLMDAHLSRSDESLKQLDFEMKKQTDGVNNDINKICIPEGLMKKFPANNLQLMVQSGAKGAIVNAMQISCLLGQIELEGRRVPLMLNGSSLPSFLPYDTSPRAGGFVDGRFLTGIRPQEFFFHCMAGREGLIDTAVKTSRSGYLQRCLIKHLEGLTVNYDLTVRDSDGSVIQFLYGEDGLDVQKMQMIKKDQIPLLAKNYNAIVDEQELEKAKTKQMSGSDELKQMNKKIKRWKRKHHHHERRSAFLSYANDNFQLFQSSDHDSKIETFQENVKKELCNSWHELDFKSKRRYFKHIKKCPDPVFSKFRPDLVFGSISEQLDDIIENYISENPHNLLCDEDDEDSKDGLTGPRRFLSSEKFRSLMHLKYSRALVEPGEAVGLLAAQSIGEPSTQMTLNTFHFAGRGEMNVTLGIPRMREILMVASTNIATPTMDLPLLDIPDIEAYANKLRVKLTAVHLKQVLEDVSVKECIHVKTKMNRFRNYHIRFNFLPHKVYKGDLHTSPAFILYYVEKVFIKKFITVLRKKLSLVSSSKFVNTSTNSKRAVSAAEESENENLNSNVTLDNDNDNGGTSDEGEGDGDTTSTKSKMRHDQEFEYEDPEEQEEEPEASEGEEDEEEEKNSINSSKDQEENEETEPVMSESLKTHNHKQKLEEAKPSRINHVKNIYHWVVNYDFDTVKEQWCEVTLQPLLSEKKDVFSALDTLQQYLSGIQDMPMKIGEKDGDIMHHVMLGNPQKMKYSKLSLGENRLDIISLIEEEASKAVIHETPKIKRAFLVRDPQAKGSCEKMLKTEGVNILEMFKYGHILDLHRICSNDIHAIAQTHGIEAAARVIVKEVSNVFATYGITVDLRHLLLIADYMTFSGHYKPFNRIGMESSASPLQQMTFETAMNFLKSATLTGLPDQLKSPSARLIVGHPVNVGTGCFSLLQRA